MRVRSVHVRWLVVLAAGAAASVLVTAPGAVGAPTLGGAHGGPPTGSTFLASDIAGNGSAAVTGEPEIAQNPRDPSELFIDWTTQPINTSSTKVPRECGGESSTNGGQSWQWTAFPATYPCGDDSTAAYGPDGTLYAGSEVVASTSVVPPPCPPGAYPFGGVCLILNAYDAVLSSTDNGQTWSAPTKIMGSASEGPFPFAPGSGDPVVTFDRPWLSVDQSTNTVYAAGHNVIDHEGFVTASTNDGQSFGTIYAIDSPAYPQGGNFGGNIAAAKGVLAVVYTAASAPGATCPCTVFETSTNDGATFNRYVVPTVNASNDPQPYLAADPAHKGRFVVTIFDSTGTENQVYTTDDFGSDWQGPATVAETPPNQQFKPWISYGPRGQIVLVWRTWLGPPNDAAPGKPSMDKTSKTPYDVWAAVSTNGHSFSTPLQISVPAPYPRGYTFGDDFSWVIADNHYVYIGWGDGRDISRGGGTQTWFARVSYNAFKG
jgi:hypothetical protein